MTMKTGNISVQTENIFPIIKKFLYSEHEIFLRELVSNATDACTKLKTLAARGENTGDIENLRIDVVINAENKTLSIRDTGLGMSADEVEKYINQIAFSGAKEFVTKYEGTEGAGIIGNFGLGFYSAFMVAQKVELSTKSYSGAPAVKWTCDGSPEYTLEEIEKTARGTEVKLFLNPEDEQYLDKERIRELLDKFCKFLPVPIFLEEEQINSTEPAWVKKPNELSDEDYKNFYRELYPMSFEEPLFHIHLNVDYPFNLTGILYFPRMENRMEIQRNKIKLYSNRVFVSESVEGIVPEFLTLLHGVMDSPDIPLNVSRSYLQGDPNVKKISNHITKKVADKLADMCKNNRADLESKWNDIKLFINFGLVTDEKFAERTKDLFLLRSVTADAYFTLPEYMKKIGTEQKNKDGKLIVLYTNDAVAQHAYITGAREQGYDVVLLDTPLDAHVINKLEALYPETRFTRVDSDALDKIIDKGEARPEILTEVQKTQLKPVFEKVAGDTSYQFEFAALNEKDAPVLITENEFMRRMQEMQAVGGGGFMGAFPGSYKVLLNSNHPLFTRLSLETDTAKQESVARHVFQLGLLNKNLLKGEALTEFVKRSLEML